MAMEADAFDNTRPPDMPRITPSGVIDSWSPGRSFAHVNSTQSCPPREALLSSGPLCLKNGIPSEVERKGQGSPDEASAVRRGNGWHGGVRGGVRAAVAACARGRRHPGG